MFTHNPTVYLHPSFHLPLGVAAGEMALFHEDLQRNCNVGALSICDIYRVNTSQERLVGLSWFAVLG